MEDTFFQKQDQQPLFPNILFNQPEQRERAGKLAIIGGHSGGFKAVADAYQAALSAKIGIIRTVLPSSIAKTIQLLIEDALFSPATKSGSFSLSALSDWLSVSQWADGVLLPGDLGSNSETAVLFERYLEQEDNLLVLTQDSLDQLIVNPLPALSMNRLVLCCQLKQLQSLLSAIRFPSAATSNMTIYQTADLLHRVSANYPFTVCLLTEDQMFVAHQGQVSATKRPASVAEVDLAATAAVWGLQQPAKPFEAITTGLFQLASLHRR